MAAAGSGATRAVLERLAVEDAGTARVIKALHLPPSSSVPGRAALILACLSNGVKDVNARRAVINTGIFRLRQLRGQNSKLWTQFLRFTNGALRERGFQRAHHVSPEDDKGKSFDELLALEGKRHMRAVSCRMPRLMDLFEKAKAEPPPVAVRLAMAGPSLGASALELVMRAMSEGAYDGDDPAVETGRSSEEDGTEPDDGEDDEEDEDDGLALEVADEADEPTTVRSAGPLFTVQARHSSLSLERQAEWNAVVAFPLLGAACQFERAGINVFGDGGQDTQELIDELSLVTESPRFIAPRPDFPGESVSMFAKGAPLTLVQSQDQWCWTTSSSLARRF
jgi:hypothetical protein